MYAIKNVADQVISIREWAINRGMEPLPPPGLETEEAYMWKEGLLAEDSKFHGFRIELRHGVPLFVTPGNRCEAVVRCMEALGGSIDVENVASLAVLERCTWVLDSCLKQNPDIVTSDFLKLPPHAVDFVKEHKDLCDMRERRYGAVWWLQRFLSTLTDFEHQVVMPRVCKILLVLLVSGRLAYVQPSKVAAAVLACILPNQADELCGYDFFDYYCIQWHIADLANLAYSLPDTISPAMLRLIMPPFLVDFTDNDEDEMDTDDTDDSEDVEDDDDHVHHVENDDDDVHPVEDDDDHILFPS